MGNKYSSDRTAKSPPTLDEQDLQFLRENTMFDEDAIREMHRNFYENCPSGRLTRQKFVDIYKVFFPNGKAGNFADHVFRAFDQDNSGYIEFREFLLAVGITSSNKPEEKLKWAFRLHDIDGNGRIDKRETKKIIEAVHALVGKEGRQKLTPHERAERVFEQMDVDHSGYLSQDEFINGCLMQEDMKWLLQALGGQERPPAY